jgi:hypothetical protein
MRDLEQVEKFFYLSEAISVCIIIFSHVEFLPRVDCERRSISYMIAIAPNLFQRNSLLKGDNVVPGRPAKTISWCKSSFRTSERRKKLEAESWLSDA